MVCLISVDNLPLIKDLDDMMDCDVFKNYRPVSNLLFSGKSIKRIVAIRLNKHWQKTNCTPLANILKVINDLLIVCDQQKPTVFLLLDINAAFDTVDQAQLLAIPRNEIGMIGTALKWFKSSHTERCQKARIGLRKLNCHLVS